MRGKNVSTGLREGCDQTSTGVERFVYTKYSAITGKAEEKIRQESSWCKSLLGGRLRMGISERYTTERDEKAPQKKGGDPS